LKIKVIKLSAKRKKESGGIIENKSSRAREK